VRREIKKCGDIIMSLFYEEVESKETLDAEDYHYKALNYVAQLAASSDKQLTELLALIKEYKVLES